MPRRAALPAALVRLAAVLLALAVPLVGRADDAPPTEFPPAAIEFFETSVRPLLAARCYECHGTGDAPEAGLRLISRESILRGGETGPAALPGEPNRSLLVEAVRYLDALQMPPDARLGEAEIAALTRWVELGLPWPAEDTPAAAPQAAATEFTITPEQRRFWSFQPVIDPPVPSIDEDVWSQGGIDRFLRAAQRERNLAPAAPASRRELIRRVTFDLTGLPPTPEEAAEFAADPSPEAYARLVDRLLASPAYGERWGRHWLDVVRYADSKDVRDIGQPYDIVETYRYRDWVVRALNADLPFSDFLVHQIAGDLLPAAEPGQVNADGIIASSLLTIGCWGPGDADTQKMHTDMVDDQINAVSRAFMALTVGCARCHDHKFDPISTADYYGLAGIFFSTQIAVPQISAPYNKVPLATPDEMRRVEEHAACVVEAEKRHKEFADAEYAAAPRQFLTQASRYLLVAWDYSQRGPELSRQTPAEFAAAAGLQGGFLKQWIEYLSPDERREKLLQTQVRDIAGAAGTVGYRGEANEPIVVVNPTDAPVNIPGTIPPHTLAVHPGPKAGVAVVWQSPMDGGVRVVVRVADAHAACGDGVDWRIELHRGSAGAAALAEGYLANGGAAAAVDPESTPALAQVTVAPGDQLRLVVLPHGEYTCDMTEVELTVEELPTAGETTRRWRLADDVVPDLFDGDQGNPHRDRYGNDGVWRFVDLLTPDGPRRAARGPQSALAGWWQALERAQSGGLGRAELVDIAAALQESLGADPSETAAPQDSLAMLREDLTAADGPFRIAERDPALLPAAAQQRLSDLAGELEALRAAAPPPIQYAMGAKEGGVPGTKYEGFHDAQIHVRGRYDRLGPTVPRRFPQVLVAGNQPAIGQESGRLPLARWLASPEHPLTGRVIVNRLWQHHFGQGIVATSGNFGMQGERPTHPELLDWLTRRLVESGWSLKALHRLMLHSATYRQSSAADDASCAADPDNRWLARMPVRRLEAEAIRDTLLSATDGLDRTPGGPPQRKPGADALSPRRALYLMTNRSDKSGLRFLFDAADPEDIVDRRNVSTVAPQALLLLNGELLLAQAPRLVARLFAEAPAGDDQRIARAYELLYGRTATDAELALSQKFLNETAAGAKSPTAADDEALRLAWEAYAQMLLCANELVYVE